MEKNETEVFLQWGSRKRLRCVRVRGPPIMEDRSRRKISSSRFFTTIAKDNNTLFPRLTRNSELAMHKKASSGSPEKEERCYTTRDNSKIPPVDNQSGCCDNNNNNNNNSNNKRVWPKLYVSLSSKEKEEDFMAMKGCKLPQRPKKRAKLIQRTLLLVSPGAWLTDMSIERYEVREKKTSKKRARGLKAMGSVESDSE